MSGTIVVNCLAKAVAIALLFERVLVVGPEVKVMGWLGAVCVRFWDSCSIIFQKCVRLCLCEHDSDCVNPTFAVGLCGVFGNL